MSPIAADAASYYTTYTLNDSERRDGAESVISANPGQTLSAHELFNHQAQQHRHSQQHPPVSSVSAAQYPTHPPQTSHMAISHYHTQAPHVSSVPSHHPSVAFTPYSHTAYHTHQLAHSAGFGPNSSAAIDTAANVAADHDYSVMAVTGAFHAPTPQVYIQPQSSHPQFIGSNGMRFRCILEAPTAAAQKADEPALTYLNKGQLYGISIIDTGSDDSFYSTTLRIAFHEDLHRKGAATYWNFWLNQQETPRMARAIELDKAGSIGVISADNKQFDRVVFQWQGQRGAKVMIRFNCLSTDFSRIKGVKGIPLRIHIDTHIAVPGTANDASGLAASIGQISSPISTIPTTNSVPAAADHAAVSKGLSVSASAAVTSMSTPVSPISTSGPNMFDQQTGSTSTFAPVPTHSPIESNKLVCGKIIERCSARIKLFRDKGAERKNKDDLRHLDKTWEKQKTKLSLNGTSAAAQQQQLNEFRSAYAPVQETTQFIEYTLTGDECDAEKPVIIDDMWSVGAASMHSSGALDSPGSSLATPVTSLSSMSIGMPTMNLASLNSPLGSASMTYMRKRSSDENDVLSSNKRQFSPASLSSAGLTSTFGPNSAELIGVDPTYVPAVRKRKSVLVIYVRFQGENIYRAIYLEHLTVGDLVSKLGQRLEMQTVAAEVEVVRRTRKGLTVKVDDGMVGQLEDEQDMEVECSFAGDTGALTIYLHY
ncbi:hypothetical protein H4S00_004526 [Coemansia sp. D1744]|nr:hypothetical protein IWW49_002236 [Coemansia sp. RSA 1797]KAJ2716493.1 hypothetical protein H4S00_004526 [Coemansia sp. D1744]